MRVIDALHATWAIRPEMLQTMLDIFERHARGEGFNREAIEAAIGKPLNNQPRPYQVVDGVAVLNLVGVLGKRMSLFADISGGASTQVLQKELATALSDPTAHSILLYIDSPGGEVDGTQALSTDVYNARAIKPIVALGDGQIASAAYWIGSAAERVFITSDTTIVGSIGTVISHTDISRAQEMRGVKTTEITAGKYKRIASMYAPLSAEGKQSLQDFVDHPYSVFVDDVARNRGTDAETVLKDMADGRIFIGQQAIDAGLVDGFATLDSLIAQLNDERATGIKFGATTPNSKTGETMKTEFTAEQLEAAKTEAFERGKAEGLATGKTDGHALGKTEGHATGKAEGLLDGANQERERIKAVEAQTLPGHEPLVATLKFDGKTTGAEAAVKVLNAEREKKGQVHQQLIDDAPKGVPTNAGEPTAKAEPEPQQVAKQAREYQDSEKAKGRDVRTEEAVRHVRKQLGLK